MWGRIYTSGEVNLTTPAWLLITTANVYLNDTLIQQAKVVTWMERVLNEANILHADTLPANWIRSEALISLKPLTDNKDSG
jgi:hypothetical protein